MALAHWETISPSEFQWEKEALKFIKSGLPTSSLYHAWSNFEFVAENGTISEVDLLIITPHGFYLIEIKSRPGTIAGNSQTWIWENEKSTFVADNPLLLANKKAKRLAGLLKKQVGSKINFPFLEPLIFCSHPDTKLELTEQAAYRVCLRDAETSNGGVRAGILAALMNRDFAGANENYKPQITPSVVRAVAQAMENIGIQTSQRNRQVGDYVLREVLYENPLGTFKDWLAGHNSLKTTVRRIRVYDLARNANEQQKEVLRRAARREFQILENLPHPNILQAESYTEHAFGPALVFKHEPEAARLDLYLTKNADSLTVENRLHILRQTAEAIKYAHEKKVVHRLLCPQSIWATEKNGQIAIKVFNWQTGIADFTSGSTGSTGFGSTLHPEYFVEDSSEVYFSPESIIQNAEFAEHLDLFSLGAIAFHLFSGQMPAANRIDLLSKVREGRGLQISSVIDGAGKKLQELIQFSTHPEVSKRIETVAEFLERLSEVEAELTTPQEIAQNPLDAKAGDLLPGGFVVKSRLGSGSSAVAFLVERDNKETVLKLANRPEHNERLREEAEVAKKLRHPNIVEAYDTIEINGLTGYTMQKAVGSRRASSSSGDGGGGNPARYEGTLAQRIKTEGRLHLELLQRFGEDLLEAVKYLEQFGVHHRDIKPENIGIRPLGKSGELHLMLFDFSLSKVALENIRAGTPQYLDPFLSRRNPPRWDLYAERFSAAVTIYEMATGELPVWGDGKSNPEVLECDATLQTELFDPTLREKMQAFFEKGLRCNYKERFDNAVEMLWAWQNIFKGIEEPLAGADSSGQRATTIQSAAVSTAVLSLGLSARAANVLDRIGAITVEDLLGVPLRRLYRLRGVGSRTRQEIVELVTALRERFPDESRSAPGKLLQTSAAADDGAEQQGIAEFTSVDSLAQKIVRATAAKKQEEETIWQTLTAATNPAGDDSAKAAQDFDKLLPKAVEKWQKIESLTRLRDDLIGFLEASGGAATTAELADAILAAHGSGEEEPRRSQLAGLVLRAAVAAESAVKKPRLVEKRAGNRSIIALNQDLAAYVELLGETAARLAEQTALASPSKVLEELRAVPTPDDFVQLVDQRLIKLSVALTDKAAASNRLEIYPIGMPALEALRLAQGTLYGTGELTYEEIKRRVASRYPLAEELPARPILDSLLNEIGLELKWTPAANNGKGAYCYPQRDVYVSGLSSSTTNHLQTLTGAENGGTLISPEIADARVFENKLRRASAEGAFLVLQTSTRSMREAEAALTKSFAVETINFDALLIQTMREQAAKLKVDWQTVLKADAAEKGSVDWRNLIILVARSLPIVEAKLSNQSKTVLLTCAGLLGRYDKLDLLDRFRNQIGFSDSRLHGLWLLLATDGVGDLPRMDGKPVPVTSTAQWAVVPDAWLSSVSNHQQG